MGWLDNLIAFFRPDDPEVGPHAPRRIGGPTAEGSASFASSLVASVSDRLRIETTRRASYSDFDQMDAEAPECHRALDSFIDTATQPGPAGSILRWTYYDEGVRAVVEPLLARLQIEARIWGHMRSTRHLGDVFVELVWDANGVLRRAKDLPARRIERVVDGYGVPDPQYPWRETATNDGYGEVARFREWQIVHFAEVPSGRVYGYSRSQLAAARRPWKALELAQNAILAERVLHTGTRLSFTIDCSGLSSDEAIEYLREVRRDYQQTRTHDASTGKRSNQFSPLTQFDDVFVPWAQNGPQKPVDVLRFGAEIGEIADIKFIYDRFLTALEVPRYDLGLDADIRSKAATNVIDAGYFRRVVRAQTVYLRGLTTMVNRALFVAGFPEALLGDFRRLYRVEFGTLQLVEEKVRWEVALLRAQVAKIYAFDLGIVSDRFVLTHFLGLTDEEVDEALPGAPPATEAQRRAGRGLEGDAAARLISLVGEDGAREYVENLAVLVEARRNRATSDALAVGDPAGVREIPRDATGG